MGLGILILLPKQLGAIEYLCIQPWLPPLSSVGPSPFIVLTKKSCLYCQIFPLGLLIINYLTLVTMVTAITWKKLHGKLRSLYFVIHVIKKSCLKEIGIPFYIRLLYSFCVLFLLCNKIIIK